MESSISLPRMALEKWIDAMSNVATTCVDNILFQIKGNQRRVLLGIRSQAPAKGCLYPIGSLNQKNLFGYEITGLVAKKETGLEVIPRKKFGFYEKLYSEAQHLEVKNGLHNNCIAYLTEIVGGELKLDETHANLIWINSIDEFPLPPYTKTLLEDSGVFTAPVEVLRKQQDFSLPTEIISRILDYRKVDFSKYILKV